MCHVYPVEDCMKGLQGSLFKLPYTSHDTKLNVSFGNQLKGPFVYYVPGAGEGGTKDVRSKGRDVFPSGGQTLL